VAALKAKLAKLYEDTRAGKCRSNVGQVCATIAGVELKALDLVLRERETVVKEKELELIKIPEVQEIRKELREVRELYEESNQSSSAGKRGNPWAS